MEKLQRLTGIDLIRGFAAYGVAILHSGDVTTAKSVSFWATQLQRFCGFAVPFFLIASFYLLINRIYVTGKSYSLKSRFQRLIIPYLVWSALYVLMRLGKLYFLKEQVNSEKITDITAIVFLGSGGIHLYFIPLLFTGALFLGVVEKLIKRNITLLPILFLFVLSSIADYLVFVTGNSFKLGSYVAFENLVNTILPNGNENPLIRVTLVFLAWLIKCLPYIFAALLINYMLKGDQIKPNRPLLIVSLIAFLGFSALGFVGIDINAAIYTDNRPPIYEVAKAIPLLVFAIFLSFELPSSSLIKSLGICSFGIYLMHQALIQILRVPIAKISPDLVLHVSIPTQLLFASLSVGISWFLTSLLMRRKLLGKVMFGA